MNSNSNWRAGLGLAVLVVCAGVRADESSGPALIPFVLPWDDASAGVTNAVGRLGGPAIADARVVVRDGHLHAGAERIRLFGVNLCFGANFPDKKDAPKVAARMAKFGINAVRFHHMDTSPAPNGLLKADALTIDPERLDRLDFLIAQLKAHGIYADLNLHVGRVYPGLPKWEGMPSYHKGVDNFDARMIQLQKDYARDLLAHVNPYTKSRYADEPAVALVEINNENALTHEWWTGEMDEMPAVYAEELAGRWNRFLKKRYPTEVDLRKAWLVREEKPGRELLRNTRFADGMEGWDLEQHEGAAARAVGAKAGAGVTVAVTTPGKQSWHVQLNQGGLQLESGRPYTLRFRARADRATRVALNAMQAHEPWRQLWTGEVELGPASKEYSFTFAPTESDTNARITFSGLAARVGEYTFESVSLVPGGVLGLRPGEAPGRIGWFRKRDFSARTPEAQRDWLRFLQEVERDYWTGMARYLKKDLGARAPIVGTQMGWGPAAVQAEMDVIDSHAYWQHPHFPGRPWDPEDWVVRNTPMAGQPDGGTLPGLGLMRIAGKPFICTEYNHAAPNTYSSETFPLLAAYAARQDWDGFFGFAYAHRKDDWDTGHIGSFFDIDQHPGKMVTLPAAAAMFRRVDVPVAARHVTVLPTPEAYLDAARLRGPWVGADALGLPRAEALTSLVSMNLSGQATPDPVGDSQENRAAFRWQAKAGGGVVTVDTPRSKAVVGSVEDGPFTLGEVVIAPGRNRQDWAAVTLTVMEGKGFRSPGRFLITATGLVENTGMAWKDAEHASVGRSWGKRPSLVEGVPVKVRLPLAAGKVKAWALDERGQRRQPIAVQDRGGQTELALGPEAGTLWYEVEAQP